MKRQGYRSGGRRRKEKKNYEQTAAVTWSGAESAVKDGGELAFAGKGEKQDESRSKDA